MKLGDVVQLRSGGPLMTVVGIQPRQAACVWFDRKQKYQSGVFDVAGLMVKDPAKGLPS